jgi:sugar O-acyltransferase (sialic acid O-acetyltransferase NeuD family)
MKPLLIYGAGGLGREVFAMVKNMNKWDVLGFVDDHLFASDSTRTLKIIGNLSTLNNWSRDINVIVAIGNPISKASIVQAITNPKVFFPTLIHPNAFIMDPDTVKLGNGTIVTAGAILTTNIDIGEHVLVNLNSTVGHECVIGDYTSIMPGVNVAGNVTINDRVLIGSGANIRNHVVLGRECVVGMGSVVLNNVGERLVVVGIPAKSISE